MPHFLSFFRYAISVATLAVGWPALAQISPVSQILEESALDINQLEAFDSLSLSPVVLHAVEGGGAELRQQVSFDPAKQTLHVAGFLATPGAPIPTASVDMASTLWSVDAAIQNVTLTNAGGLKGVVLSGTMTSGSTAFDDPVGSTVVVSFGYNQDGESVSFSSVSINILGGGSLFSASGTGRVGVSKKVVTAVASPHGGSVTSLQFTLDGTASSSTTPGA